MPRSLGKFVVRHALLLAVAAALALPAAAAAADSANSFLAETPISAGGSHTCAVTAAGTVACWGDDSAGQADAPAAEFLSVSAGGSHTCGILADGTLDCWGDDTAGQLANAPDGQFVAISAGGRHTCALRVDGKLACWGDEAVAEPSGDRGVPSGYFLSVSAGGTHSCGISIDGTLACWGGDSVGQVSKTPDGLYVAVSAGGTHSCAINATGILRCWGDNGEGQLDGIPGGQFRAVSAGASHTCAIRGDGTLACWGDNSAGQLGGIPSGRFRSVAAGGTHTCAIRTDGTTSCWGQGLPGQPTPAPPTAALGHPALSTGTGSNYNCLLQSDGGPSCWGADAFGAPLQGTPAEEALAVSGEAERACALAASGGAACWGPPPPIGSTPAPTGAFRSIASTADDSCAIGLDSQLACWGGAEPALTPPSGQFRAVSGGGGYACGIHVYGDLRCWGQSPAVVNNVPNGNFRSISTGEDRACGVKLDGVLLCWGANDQGFVDPIPQGPVRAVAAGAYNMCAILAAGDLSCWEDGATTDAPSGTFYSLSGGANHTCGVRTNGALTCVGHNEYGQTRPQLLQLDLPQATFGVPYSHRIDSTPSEPAPKFSAVGNVPDGLVLAPDGTLAGTPTKAGDFTFSVIVKNGVGDQSKEEVSMVVVGPPGLTLDPAHDVGFASATLSGTVDPRNLATGAWFEYWPAGGSSQNAVSTPVQAVGDGATPVPVSAAVTGLSPDTEYLFRLGAANELAPQATHSGAQTLYSTLSPPTDGKNFNVETTDGKVETKCPSDRSFARLVKAAQVPVGCLIDTSDGTVRITASKGNGKTQTAHFWGGLFRVGQNHGVNQIAVMKLAGQLRCERRKSSDGNRIRLRRGGGGRHLWGSGKGNYKTVGSHGAATVRGTIWLVVDRCDGSTLIKVKKGTVWVNDFVKGIKVVVHAGEQYVIEPPTARLGK